MKKLFFCLLLINSSELIGQHLHWCEGSMVLSSGKVLLGKLSFEPLQGVILFEEQGADNRNVFTAHQAKSLFFYDDLADINRRYISINRHRNRADFSFFEIVLQGEVSVLRRQRIKTSTPSDALGFDYFSFYNDTVYPLRNFNRQIYPQLAVSGNELLAGYIRENGLQARGIENAIRIIERYNHLIRSEEPMAKQ